MFRRPVLLIVAILLGVALAGLLVVAAFPPSVTPTAVERVLPNERFGPR
ncbi:MAG: hypothetical protein K2X49_28085 [Acetobacteraceae bacterium]|nr:hypothetical protein [Acetobacteraceae bacterium]